MIRRWLWHRVEAFLGPLGEWVQLSQRGYYAMFGQAPPQPAEQPKPEQSVALTAEQARLIAEHQAWLQQSRTVPPGYYDHPGHPLHGRPLIRRETGLLEASCEHGIGHPIPESVEWLDAFGPEGERGSWGVHGCCGKCCRRSDERAA